MAVPSNKREGWSASKTLPFSRPLEPPGESCCRAEESATRRNYGWVSLRGVQCWSAKEF